MAPAGRPKVDKPKNIRYSIRLDEETEKKLLAYSTRNKITRGEAIRRAILLLLKNEET